MKNCTKRKRMEEKETQSLKEKIGLKILKKEKQKLPLSYWKIGKASCFEKF